MRIPFLMCAATLVGCGGSQSAPVSPALSSVQVVGQFMRAAADSNLHRMGDLWGRKQGSANATRFPPEYEKRLFYMQLYLRGDSSRVVADQAVSGKSDERKLVVELHRGSCVRQVPFTTVRTSKGGWLVATVDISAAGNPALPCNP
jgi:hypothetical protein